MKWTPKSIRSSIDIVCRNSFPFFLLKACTFAWLYGTLMQSSWSTMYFVEVHSNVAQSTTTTVWLQLKQSCQQGSLTIVRRTNSRKNTNIQQQLQYQEALDESDYQQPPFGSDSGAEGSGGGGAGGGGQGAAGDSGGPEAEFGQQHPPLSESELAFVNSQLSRELESMQPTSGAAIVAANRTDSTTGDELDTVDLATDNLPAVDTPDACDKAAVRLRCLLRQLQRGEISAELLQKNLHYAARVLEAVFIDETK
ncbi:hypothetical protein ZHAS_00020735 [Anopheles sinensis]|uniref:Uncharacterized protein n=1 Tax=Anopheles sinensis TaxID=74873 RepID=A0A084WQJ7_ANOSI|nr:hypothetical protein ZHAS_00020735 [Anopheles sinensis]